ncbi:response regulator [Pacificibacter marinus]|uniref:Chemotaxis protein CheY n=1 Tax=Pacificibacter marinus TaxID=658057 RepID=A0A1Y5SKT6_9RHOB|nr:response regulator [Pacificibacter marinus]SEL42974.1 Response regulator receiver domain-containing protein [Pacificibacter marinus]SLN43081.1 Chemotaxis protein CheY [Pacificibacter marinus]
MKNVSVVTPDNFPTVQYGNPEKELQILIVDDSSFDLNNIERHCRRTSLYLTIDTARDVDAMLEALDTKIYDIIFLDYHLTNATGLEARKLISEHSLNSKAATIMITGEVSHEVAVSAIKNGCQDYVAKSDLDTTSLELMMKTAAKRLEGHASRVLQGQMDNIHARTMGAVTQVVQRELSDERILSLLIRAMEQVSYVDGQPVIGGVPDVLSILTENDSEPNSFVFKQFSDGDN